MSPHAPTLPWLKPSQEFPAADQAWGEASQWPGLLAAGGALDVQSLQRAYSHGIFPWYSDGQPILWWSPDPRMVLAVDNFRVHRSFMRILKKFRKAPGSEIRIDSDFEQVIQACRCRARPGQNGTWIVPDMVRAYVGLHHAGLAHSVETWVDGRLAGGLYCVALGQAVFGESMFSSAPDASKIALAALVGFCRRHGIVQIDCQQNTRHLASLGAREISRQLFLQRVALGLARAAPTWKFEPRLWDEVLPLKTLAT